jgi:sodium-dependent dicarboxylate transporter 2/3/5
MVVSVATVLLSNFMSNTAAANIVIPLSVTMAVGAEARVAVPIALSASAAMCLPIATPPNAMVFATGRCHTKDFLRTGLIVGILTPILAVLWSGVALNWLGM